MFEGMGASNSMHQLTWQFQGYLDIVRWMCEKGGAAAIIDGVRGVDVQSKDGWTPLSELISFQRLVNKF
jgi:hypothetical protein